MRADPAPNPIVTIGTARFGNTLPLALIAGPCALESREHALEMASALKETAGKAGISLVFKTSFDKANRTSAKSQRGVGLDRALPIFAEIRETLGVPVLTDVHDAQQCAVVAEAVDVLQIPAFLCRQTDLLAAAAATGRVVNVKKGQFLAPWDMANVVAKLQQAGRVGFGREQLERRAPENVPSARRLDRIDCTLFARNGDTACRNFGAGCRSSWRLESRIETAEVGRSGRKAKHVHLVRRSSVELDDLLRRQPALSGDVVKIGPELAAVTNRHFDRARSGVRGRDAPSKAPFDCLTQTSVRRFAKGTIAHVFGTVVDGHRRKRGNDVDDAFDWMNDQVLGDRSHTRIDLGIDA